MGNFISYYMESSTHNQLYNYISQLEQIPDNDISDNHISDNHISNNHISDNSISDNSISLLPVKYYKLYIYINSESKQLHELYTNAAYKHNLAVENYINALTTNQPSMENYCFDAGFDLFCPQDTESIGSQKLMLDHLIQTSMMVAGENNQFVSYYLYARSSLPLKTPLRLANSVGIIDSGYRGHIKAVFDNIMGYDFMEYTINFGTRLLQICPPNLEYPMKIIIVNNPNDLGETHRGNAGFGSTGV